MDTINASNMVRETDIKCPICGAFIVCDESVSLATNPVQHRYYCPECDLFSHVTFSNECLLAYIKKNFPKSEDSVDFVNHPPHYESGKFECIDVMVETQGRESVMAFCLCNAFKYLYRHNNKNGVEDIKKAKWYIDKYLELEAQNETAD